ncbi:hypothetical protein pEaSNUABM5_00352 [Erwinia phage pEa_SNUABM_5]|uniref:Uncharacterized protein n=1 Tax=Erwinia phage pEa_SNUABM_5 TaxID=2797313 RepID=A0A7T8EQH3_9CAUD|nr:hypothetical protein MPK73_gp352 [Erwinia phage pEa_SNUABM_5]QQO90494.1 hypothetical protein pEaSNUABM5_00352 [Erwinia phage pEa_SNUABM_5]
MSIKELERGAFALFSREGLSEEYKRLLCYIVYKTLSSSGRAMQMNRLIHEISQQHAVSREDVKGALSALRSSMAFSAVCIFTASDQNKLCRVCPSEKINAWLQHVEKEHPHLSRAIQ